LKKSSGLSKSSAIIIAVITTVGTIIVAAIQFGVFKREPTPNAIIASKALTGTIVDERTGQSISNAAISVVGSNLNYVSEINGNFKIEIKDTAVNELRVFVSKTGYVSFSKSYDLPSTGVVIALTSQFKK
jgi:hypothetical protein